MCQPVNIFLSSRRGDAQPNSRGVTGADEALVVRQPHVDRQGRGLHHHRQGQGPQPDQGRPNTRLPLRKCYVNIIQGSPITVTPVTVTSRLQ